MNQFMKIHKTIIKQKMLLKEINEITIIGPGLIGSSLGLSLKKMGISKKIVGIISQNLIF